MLPLLWTMVLFIIATSVNQYAGRQKTEILQMRRKVTSDDIPSVLGSSFSEIFHHYWNNHSFFEIWMSNYSDLK